jgi:hypothetical protein
MFRFLETRCFSGVAKGNDYDGQECQGSNVQRGELNFQDLTRDVQQRIAKCSGVDGGWDEELHDDATRKTPFRE